MFIIRNCTGGVYKSKPNLKYIRETKVCNIVVLGVDYFLSGLKIVGDMQD